VPMRANTSMNVAAMEGRTETSMRMVPPAPGLPATRR
jgi:hypothetical protein